MLKKLSENQACVVFSAANNIRKIDWFNKLSVGRSGSPAVILRPFW